MPQISVIVPIYNVEAYLNQCVDSILCQTFDDFELLLVDDGSPDGCGKICDQYAQKDRRITVIHKDNEGVSVARNTALKIAAGQYVTFCDSDDYYRPDWLEKLVTEAQKTSADLTIGGFTGVSEAGEVQGILKQETGFFLLSQPLDTIKYYFEKIFAGKHYFEVCTKLFRRDIIQGKGIRFCETCGNFSEDLGFVLEYLLYANRIVCVEDAGYCYRRRSGSCTHTSKGVARLDSVNEVGLQFLERAERTLPKELHNTLPILYFLIMYNQYSRIIGTERYPYLREEFQKINQYDQWERNTKAIFRCKKQMKSFFGRNNAKRILLFSHYCLHGNWKLFCINSAIFYRTHKIS